MAKKKVQDSESFGPYYDTYVKTDKDGVEWEQEVPAYREVITPYGMFGVPKKTVLTFALNDDDELVTVFTKKEIKAKKPKKIVADDDKAAAAAPKE